MVNSFLICQMRKQLITMAWHLGTPLSQQWKVKHPYTRRPFPASVTLLQEGSPSRQWFTTLAAHMHCLGPSAKPRCPQPLLQPNRSTHDSWDVPGVIGFFFLCSLPKVVSFYCFSKPFSPFKAQFKSIPLYSFIYSAVDNGPLKRLHLMILPHNLVLLLYLLVSTLFIFWCKSPISLRCLATSCAHTLCATDSIFPSPIIKQGLKN